MTVDIRNFPNRPALAAALAAQVSDDLRSAIAERGRGSIAVPGGTTPEPFLIELAGRPIDWRSVLITLTDERCVGVDDARSNEGLVRRSLLSGPASAAMFAPLFPDAPSIEDALAKAAGALDTVLPLSVCVLGMGEDGHTASLFPGAERLSEALDPACGETVMAIRAPGAPETRITLTLPVLNAADHIHLLITGAAKRAALDRALVSGPAAEFPVRAVLGGRKPVTVFHSP